VRSTIAWHERSARAVCWLYATGLAEICAARCADLESLTYLDEEGRAVCGWLIKVIGKGGLQVRSGSCAHSSGGAVR
jgi:hypothetical protein